MAIVRHVNWHCCTKSWNYDRAWNAQFLREARVRCFDAAGSTKRTPTTVYRRIWWSMGKVWRSHWKTTGSCCSQCARNAPPSCAADCRRYRKPRFVRINRLATKFLLKRHCWTNRFIRNLWICHVRLVCEVFIDLSALRIQVIYLEFATNLGAD